MRSAGQCREARHGNFDRLAFFNSRIAALKREIRVIPYLGISADEKRRRIDQKDMEVLRLVKRAIRR